MASNRQSRQNRSGIFFAAISFLLILYFLSGRPKHTDHREKAFQHNKIEYTEHARCRMDCRHITENEIREVLNRGEINYRKTDSNASPCPKFALEGFVDGKRVRVIVGDCDEKAVIITVIDLDHELECHCPGDDHTRTTQY
jgi:hypothetical protein